MWILGLAVRASWALFAELAEAVAPEALLAERSFGQVLGGGWHARLEFLRRVLGEWRFP